ncbi:MAG TPA: thioredoxin family protein [Thermoanaerobaculia bacterium]|jgi:thioredoxin-related protein|nr:thioredoxin family protein [Thermoanaerobaculia bacterium]
MKRLLALSTLIVLTLLVLSQAGHAAEKFDPKRDPAKDLASAVATARQEHKKIILDVGGEWCIWCHRLDDFIAGEQTLHRYMAEHYVVVKVNFSEENPNKAFLSGFPKIDGYPHLFVLDQDGKLLHSQSTGDFELGKGYNAAAFEAFLHKWAA